MATKKSAASDPLQTEGEPDRVVDPPSASADETKDAEKAAETQWVLVDQSAILTLPSGASYNLQAGNVLEVSPEDASFLVDNGYAAATEAPSYEPATGFPVEPEVEPEPAAQSQSEESSEE